MKKINAILVVDDSEGDQLLAKLAIQEFDPSIKIESAYDGKEALDLLETLPESPDFILLDINMPGMNGHEFLAEYEKLDFESTVIAMISSSDEEYDKNKCLSYPFVKTYASKPVTVDLIRELLD